MTTWPTIDEAADFTGVAADNATLKVCLDSAISYGETVLLGITDTYSGVPLEIKPSVFQACLDYCGSIYTQRIGQADFYSNPIEGSTPMQRYRKILLSSRYTAFA